ncbi:atrial natriuretic peptide-converting enzyme-like [Centroberyx affinis]|uniref:atrial natriuretic peptide-converting enzyme-like n=1 Tax=Centroberyx affinis TaxID=166261 RepID=UPI003A5B9FFF
MGGEACPHKLGSTNHLRLLLYILIPTVSLLAAVMLLILALTGIFGSGLLDSSPLPSPEPVIDSDLGYQGNRTSPSLFQAENATASLGDRSDGGNHGNNESTSGVTAAENSTSLSSSSPSPSSSSSSSSLAPPTQPFTQTPDWLTSVTSMSTPWPISTTPEPDTGSCQLVMEPQCHMLPYNQTWLTSSVAVVKSSEVDMLLRFFSYLSRLSCYRHIMLFGCSLALPECIAADNNTHSRDYGKPCFIAVVH